jgi:two-component sensor histidine kinase
MRGSPFLGKAGAMKAAPHAQNEERLRILRSYGILDSDREAEFDDIVSLAARICDAPISAVNLIDANRQWFKAEIGLGVREMPLDDSICTHAILESGYVEIGDTLDDPRMAGNPLVHTTPGLRFYAGAQLLASDGLPLGTLCVLDLKPRRLSDLQVEALRVLAQQVVKLFDLRLALNLAENLRREADHRVKNSLQSAAALIRLEARTVSHPETQEAFVRTAGRIASISALHELLGHGKVAGQVEMGAYIRRVAELAASARPPHVSVDVDTASFLIPSAKASAVGMVVNEVMMNAFKHAFADGRPGRVTVRLGMPDADRATLEVSDDGAGYREKTEVGGKGLGLQIVQASVAQIGGELFTSSGEAGGVRTTVTFPVSE